MSTGATAAGMSDEGDVNVMRQTRVTPIYENEVNVYCRLAQRDTPKVPSRTHARVYPAMHDS